MGEAVIMLIVFTRVALLAYQFLPKLSHGYSSRIASYVSAYQHSQYVEKHPKGWIPDETVNVYAGYEYIRGKMPILIAADTPPLGRYLIGLSGQIFDTEHAITGISYVLSLIFIIMLSRIIIPIPVLWLAPVVWFVFDPLMSNQLVISPLLDIQQLAWLLAATILFGYGLSSKRSGVWHFLGVNICLGAFAATKFYMSAVPILMGFSAVVFIMKRDKFITWLYVLPVSVLVMLSTYATLFAHGYTIRKFLGVQRWVYDYHKSQLLYPLSAWDLLLFNRWHVWWGTLPVISDSQWTLAWPVLTIAGVSGAVIGIVRKSPIVVPTATLALCYLAFLSIGQTTARYFVIVFPMLAILSAYAVWQVCDRLCAPRISSKKSRAQ